MELLAVILLGSLVYLVLRHGFIIGCFVWIILIGLFDLFGYLLLKGS